MKKPKKTPFFKTEKDVREFQKEYPNAIFVFGSNEIGKHGSGAARHAAMYWEAQYGQGFGLQGRAFAIPTKASPSATLPLEAVHDYLLMFKLYAELHEDRLFLLTGIGTGLAGFSKAVMRNILPKFPSNVVLPEEFL